MRLRDAVIAISLSNLFFLDVWAALQDRSQLYFRKAPPNAAELAAVTLNVLLLAALLLGGLWLTRRIADPRVTAAARCVLLALMIVPVRNMSLQLAVVSEPLAAFHSLFGRTGLLLLAAAGLMAALVWIRRTTRIIAAFLLVMSPLFVFNIANSAWMAYSARGQGFANLSAEHAPAARNPASRVLVILFDELDYRRSFVARPALLHLPELDRLRAESVFANNAYPAQWETLLSIPSMLTGRKVSRAATSGGDNLILMSGDSRVPFNTVSTVFSEARADGFRTALAGWWHPYCRVLGKELDSCLAEPGAGVMAMPQWERPQSLLANMRFDARRQLWVTPFIHRYLRTSDVILPGHRDAYLSIHGRSLSLVADPSFGFVFLHYPIPHLPGIFDPQKDGFDINVEHPYSGNLALVDRTLRELRAAMERAGTWDSTTVVVTADHPFRVNFLLGALVEDTVGSPLVPFIIKLAHEKRGVEYMPRINNRVLHDLALDLLRRHIATEPELLRWLDARSGGPLDAEPETIATRKTSAAGL
ncbi:MAG TPA: hypothetical protein VF767_09265 [Bryobacteraceae bacterium]